jgi:hypothetical protein
MNTRLVSFAVLLLAGCPTPTNNGERTLDRTELVSCEASEQCPTGNICSAGVCILGTCDPVVEVACDTEGLDGPYCCKPWELCSTLSFSCENDPTVNGIGCDPNEPTCTPCETQGDCAGGQFCSAATCLDAAGREDCTSSFQCPTGERCDRTVFLCVPDRGACQFCGTDFPELCCEDNQACSEQTGFCVDIPDAECSEDGECADGLFCDTLRRCAQCDETHSCGPGLLCDTGDGECFADRSCVVDGDCNGNERCPPTTLVCILPECQSDNECIGDARLICNEGTFKCELPDPVCPDDVDEENDTTALASELVDGVSFSGYLCRDDTDVLSFPVNPNKRYTATVDLGGSGQPGIIVSLLDDDLAVESTASFNASQASIQLAGVTGPAQSGTFYLKLQGNNDDSDHWTYTVTVAEAEPSQVADCTPAGQAEEPNNDFATATPVVLGAARTFSRCGTADVDFYRVTVPALNGVQATVANFFNIEGNLNVELYQEPNDNTGSRIDSATNINDIEIVDGTEVALEFWVKVFLASPAGAVTEQTYSVTTVAVPRPAACFPDASEPDGDMASARVLTLAGTPTPSAAATDIPRCNAQDKDFFRFAMPPNLGGIVLLRFTHSEGDMALDLLDAASGAVIDTSNVSNAASDPDEQVEVPGSATDTIEYVAVARLNGATGGIVGQKYSIEVQTFDNSQCIASEPSGGDDVFANGRCIGDFTELREDQPCTNDAARIGEPMLSADLAGCALAAEGSIPGCGRICGNGDGDWYRAGVLNNDQVLHAILDYNPLDGELGLARGTLTTVSGAVVETPATDTDHDGHLELSFAAPKNAPKEYGIRVKPNGSTGHQVQLYSLKVEVGLECLDDAFDAGALVNEKPVNAVIVRPNPDPGAPLDFTSTGLSRCSNDVDVFEMFAFSSEAVTVELDQQDTSPNGLIVELGTRPANLNNAAPVVDDDAPIAVAGSDAITFANTLGQQLYVTVRAQTGIVVTGPYTLRITASR